MKISRALAFAAFALVLGATSANAKCNSAFGLCGLTEGYKQAKAREAADKSHQARRSCYQYQTRGYTNGVPYNVAVKANQICKGAYGA